MFATFKIVNSDREVSINLSAVAKIWEGIFFDNVKQENDMCVQLQFISGSYLSVVCDWDNMKKILFLYNENLVKHE